MGKTRKASKTYTTQVLALDDEGLAAVAGLTRGDVRWYVGLRDGGELVTVSERADRIWSRLFVEVRPDGRLVCECKRRTCAHRGAVLEWLRFREARSLAARGVGQAA